MGANQQKTYKAKFSGKYTHNINDDNSESSIIKDKNGIRITLGERN